MKELPSDHADSRSYRCKRCFENESKLLCTVCKEEKSKRDFDMDKVNNHNTGIRRCRNCHRCKMCGLTFDDARQLQCNIAQCTKCVTQKCSQCGIEKLRKEFSETQRHNAVQYGRRKIQCHACAEMKLYTCDAPPCQKKHIEKPQSEFDKKHFAKWARHKEREKLICNGCEELGYSTRRGGTDTFSCARCRKSMGTGRFDPKSLNNKKNRPDSTLYCLQCRRI